MNRAIRRLLQRYKTNCPFALAKRRGIILVFEDLGDSTYGMYYTKFRQRYIVINNRLCEIWQRVVCAHELGHDVLHRGVNRFFTDNSTFFMSSKYERQANVFTVELLTATEAILDGESIENYFCRLEIPMEMAPYYNGAF